MLRMTPRRTLLAAIAALTALTLPAVVPHAAAQRPQKPRTGFAFYDADRLYDTLPSPFYDDADFTPQGRLKWDTERYRSKIRRTAAVIDSMALPLVALYGVENERVVRDLAAACRGDYSYLHRTLNTLDGLDFALLYYGDRFFPHRTEPGDRTLYVEGTLGRDTVGCCSSATGACCPGSSANCTRSGRRSGSSWPAASPRATPPAGDCTTPRPAPKRPGAARCAAADGGSCATAYSRIRGWRPHGAMSTPAGGLSILRRETRSEPSTGSAIGTDTEPRCPYSYTYGRFFWRFRKVLLYSQSLHRK